MNGKLRGFVATAVVLLVGALAPRAAAVDMGQILSGESRSGTFSAGSSDVWSFTYSAGDVVAIKGAPGSGNTNVAMTIMDANNVIRQTLGCSGGGNNSSAYFRLPAAGTYTATVSSCSGTYAGPYFLSFLSLYTGATRMAGDPAQEGGPIVSAQTVEGNTTEGDLDVFQFRAEAGDRVVLSSAHVTPGPNPKFWLFRPNTSPSYWTSLVGDNNDRQELTLNDPGTYTLLMQSQDVNTTGAYYVTLQRLPGATADCYTVLPDADGGVVAAAPTATVSGSIVRKTDMDPWEFYATAGQTATITTSRYLRVSLYAPQYVSYQRQFGAPIFTNTATCTLATTNTVSLPTTGFYELLVEECTVTNGGAYTLSLTLPSQSAPPPLANPAPAACGPLTNVFATDILGWDALPAATNYEVFLQEGALAGNAYLGNVLQPPAGRPVFALPYQGLQTGNVYSWYVSAWDTQAYTYSPTYTFGLSCAPTVSVSPAAPNFGDVLVGTTSAPLTVTITNSGTCYEDPRVVSVPAAFTVLNDTCTTAPAGGHLAPAGDSCSFQVTFSPTSQGPYAGGLTLEGFLPEAHGGVVDLAGRGVLPDLRVTALSVSATPVGGAYVQATDTTGNYGDGPAAASAVTYRFSLDQTLDAADLPASSGSRATPAFAPAATSSGTVNVYLPQNLPSGAWYVFACVDEAAAVTESDENNNCLVSPATVSVLRDVQVVQVSDPAQPGVNGTFSFTDTTRNAGSMPVPATVTTYRLSLDQKITRLDPVLVGTRAIPALPESPQPGYYSTGTVTLGVAADTPRGTYFVAACADGTDLLGETDELNNCRLSKTTIRVEPNLAVGALSNPPATGAAGTTFSVTDTTANSGLGAAAASSTRYRLSLDTTVTDTDPLLTGSRSVPALGVGGSSSGSATLTVPGSVPQGTFYLAACADDGRAVTESNEADNCRVSSGTISISRPDLVVTGVGSPPAAGVAGDSFPITDTTANTGVAAAVATVTAYRLSADTTISPSDPLLTGTRSVPTLAPGASSTGTVTVTIPANLAPNTYYLGACADSKNAASEAAESNNCMRATTRITVSSPDLQVTALTEPPAVGNVNGTFPISETTRNASASVPAVASVTRYRLTTDAVVTGSDPLLTGTRAVPALGAGASSAGTVTVTIPALVPEGSYYLAACADDGRTVAESNENNNCRVSAGRMTMARADMVVSGLSNPPAAGVVGTTFTVSETTTNGGVTTAPASVTGYRLSLDTTIGSGDPALSGTRAVPALLAGAASAGSGTVVTIPASVPEGTYYLGACADEGAVVSESNEGNNCVASATRITITKADLRVTSVSEPPTEGDLGQTFEITDATTNSGQTQAGASTTRYRLSLDTTIGGSDPVLTGSRPVPALAVGQTSTGTVTVTIPATIVQGSYYLAACADATSAVAESNEGNNCAVSTTTLDVINADLRVTALSEPPAQGYVGTAFSVTDTTTNAGATTDAKSTTTSYRLSLDTIVSGTDPLLTGTRAVAVLGPGADSTGTATVTIPAAVAQGVYYLVACADESGAVTESDETNNCRVSTGTISVLKPDLQVTAASEPPAQGVVGTSFSVTETTANLGVAPAGASTTRYRLSLDATVTRNDPLLTGTRAVGGLAVGAASPGTATVTIPATIAQGDYYLGVCADDLTVVSENDETNNCRASAGTIALRKPDLAVTAVTNPPAQATAGTSFSVTDTTANGGAAAAAASTTRYRLSLDATVNATDPLLTGSRDAGALAAGGSSSGSVTVTVPGTVAEGTYYLAACADDLLRVSETNETNNCRLAATTVELRKADLRVTALTSPPASGTVGASFPVTDTTSNVGAASAPASTTRYRLSADTTINASDPLLSGTRAVGVVAAAGASTGSVTLTIPESIPQGVYYLGACADDQGAVDESSETNNCFAAAGTINLAKADLRVTSISNPPAALAIGASIVVTDTTENAGAAPSVASTTRYRLSADTTITGADALLVESGARHTVPALDPGQTSGASVTATIPAVAQGSYYLAACADEGNLVSESSETNNCTIAATQLYVRRSDLAVTSVTDPPASGVVGTSFEVTDTTVNGGLTDAGASATRYRLSADTTITTGDALLTGSRAVAALGVGAESTGTVSVSIPSAVAQGVYYLAACADDAGAIPESDEENNCRVSAGTINLRKADLRATVVSNPPGEGLVGGTFSVTDTTGNFGLADAGASTTRYRLSADTTISTADTLLTGTRAAGALAMGASSSGTVTVTIPASVAQGSFWLAACADDNNLVSESNETNNCALSTTQIQIKKADLLVTAVSDPPAQGIVGASFSVTDTTENAAAALAAAGASSTRFRLSADTTITTSDPLLTGARAVAALAIGEASTGSTVVTIPATVAEGSYYLAACADGGNAVSESSETNNCAVSATWIELRKSDLRVTAVSDPPAEGAAGTTFTVTDTTENRSGVLTDAPASTTRYHLSTDTAGSTSDPLLTGERAVATLAPGQASNGSATVTIPASIAQGTYYLVACADDGAVVSEGDETNNCFTSAGQISVLRPDLTVTAVGNPPAESAAGATFTASDTTRNDGQVAADASSTRYRLSLDAVITSSDTLMTGARAVPALASGASSAGSVTVTVPTTMAEGDYYLGACADAGGAVAESSETNNCLASGTTVSLWKPDLLATAVSDPPAEVTAGLSTFDVTDTTANVSTRRAAPATITRHYLSISQTSGGIVAQLTGERAVPALAAGAASSGTVTVAVPGSVVEGTYWLLACADATAVAAESSEANCAASAAQVLVRKPDLTLPLLADPPASARIGTSFSVSDTTSNIGTIPSPASTTVYRLSLDLLLSGSDPVLTGDRAVPALPAGAESAGTATVTVPLSGVPVGLYYLIACADGGDDVAEALETNNCRAAATRVQILAAAPDLVATIDLVETPQYFFPGLSYVQWNQVDNVGAASAAASTTRFRLSTDRVITGADPLLTGTLATPVLGPGQFQLQSGTLTVPASVPEGAYYLAACADDTAVVTESDETNNCSIVGDEAPFVTLRWADLAVAAITNYPPFARTGEFIDVTDTVVNGALTGGDALAFAVSYRLSTDPAIGAGDPLLTGTRTVAGLAAGASSSATTMVQVPPGTAPGFYYIGVCADSAGVVPESDEADNCSASGTTIEVQ